MCKRLFWLVLLAGCGGGDYKPFAGPPDDFEPPDKCDPFYCPNPGDDDDESATAAAKGVYAGEGKTLTIYADGSVFGADANGCNSAGRVEPIADAPGGYTIELERQCAREARAFRGTMVHDERGLFGGAFDERGEVLVLDYRR